MMVASTLGPDIKRASILRKGRWLQVKLQLPKDHVWRNTKSHSSQITPKYSCLLKSNLSIDQNGSLLGTRTILTDCSGGQSLWAGSGMSCDIRLLGVKQIDTAIR
jgi:hypothetical protein